MVSVRPVVEIARVCAVELIQTVQHVFRRMRVYHVQHHVQAFAVGDVDQLFQVFGRTETAEMESDYS